MSIIDYRDFSRFLDDLKEYKVITPLRASMIDSHSRLQNPFAYLSQFALGLSLIYGGGEGIKVEIQNEDWKFLALNFLLFLAGLFLTYKSVKKIKARINGKFSAPMWMAPIYEGYLDYCKVRSDVEISEFAIGLSDLLPDEIRKETIEYYSEKEQGKEQSRREVMKKYNLKEN